MKPWDWVNCGRNSDGFNPVYGPFPALPRPELGDRCGASHIVFFWTWHRELGPLGGTVKVAMRRTFHVHWPSGTKDPTWIENA